MYEIFEQLLKERGITPYRVHKETGVPQSTLSDWKNGKGTPKAEKLKVIANYFNVSVDYLLGNEQKNKPAAEAEGLSKNDIEFLSKIRKLNPSNLELAKVQIDALLALQEKQGK